MLKKKKQNISVVYIKGEDFTNQMIDSLAKQAMKEFRDEYRKCDLLMIDDIQFIAGKESTQEEFFHTFNKLYEEHKQIVMTSDRKPSDMATLEDRLRTRFEWGLLADIEPPDYETSMAIIKNKATRKKDTVVWVILMPPKMGIVKYINAPSTFTFIAAPFPASPKMRQPK